MNTNRIDGTWEQVKGSIQKAWGKLTNDDLDVIEGDRKQLSGKIQERYGYAQDKVDEQVRRWNDGHDESVIDPVEDPMVR
jgi:uncharacterized protein YjbJ (UPF0337 family)